MVRGKTTVSIKDLVLAMKKVIEQGNEDPQANVNELSMMLGLTPTTVKQKIRQAKFKFPHVRLLDLSRFVGKTGQRAETYSANELDSFFAELLNRPVKEIQEEVKEAKQEIETDLANRKPRGRASKKLASSAS